MENEVALIALGSNWGNSRELLNRAFASLQELSLTPLIRSSIWKTAPVDCPPGSPSFLNAAAAIHVSADLSPEVLLKQLKQLESDIGRVPKKIHNEPRAIDLDIISFGKKRWNSETLTLPHPRAHLRRFVLVPLAEIAPGFCLPGFDTTVGDLLRNLHSSEILSRHLVDPD
ncbi:MAG: 7 8-dihydro-6-hydroxymethylpterin-pyrophosphokinae hppk [Verrucomicrobiales bacterium]|nr:7 8-dihydro-6-hydroxymethylpterin-pyrophosphokinae hppk [Verrucomicrobiales bacterium]